MFKRKKLRKSIKEIEEGDLSKLKSKVVVPKKVKKIKTKEVKSGKMELKEIKPPYPKCPSCSEYLKAEAVYNKKGRQKYDWEWTKGHQVKWSCDKCGAEYESIEEDEQLLKFEGKERQDKVIYVKK